MNILLKYAAAALAVGGMAIPVSAATTTAAPPAQKSEQSSAPAQRQLTEDLAKAGFTDIKLMPESFLVRAKDSKGNPVMMVINPDSFTAVTEVTAPSKSSDQMSSGGSKMSNGANANGNSTPPAKQ
jgi:hypothetical protein